MPTHHDDIMLTAGDDWLIAGSLVDDAGAPLDLSSAEIVQWVLLGPDGNPALVPGTATIEIADPPTDGLVNVSVPSSATKLLNPGNYIDAMRVVMTEQSRSGVWQGIIGVWANPFDYFDNLVPAAFVTLDQSGISSPEIGAGDLSEIAAPINLAADNESIGALSVDVPDLEEI
jgi:hypothetical protein